MALDLTILGHAPGKQQVAHFLLARRAFGHHLEFVIERQVGILHQQAAGDPLEIETLAGLSGPLAAFQQAHVLLGRHDFHRCRSHLGRNDHFDELALDDGLRRCRIQFAIEGDDAAKSRFRIGLVGAVIGVQQVLAIGNAARIGVLDDDAGRFGVELLDAFQGRIGIGDVVVGQFLALQLARRGDGGLGFRRRDIEGAVLVRILAIAAVLRLGELQVEALRESLALAVVHRWRSGSC